MKKQTANTPSTPVGESRVIHILTHVYLVRAPLSPYTSRYLPGGSIVLVQSVWVEPREYALLQVYLELL